MSRVFAVAAIVASFARVASADSTSGVDGALFRSSYDSNGVLGIEGARLLPLHDLSLKFNVGYGTSPVRVAVPGIGDAAGDTNTDRVLDRLLTLEIAFGLTLSKRFAIGFNVGAYRTETGDGYGTRGRYMTGNRVTPSTGLISLRRISNIDPSANPNDATSYQGDGLAGPLDARVGGKLALISSRRFALTAVGSVFLPFGEDEMLLGDRGLVFEPKLAAEMPFGRLPFVDRSSMRLTLNAGARFRRRTVLEGFDTQDPSATDADAKAFLDVGSELVLGLGLHTQITPRLSLLNDVQAFVPLPDALSFGSCRRFDGTQCSDLMSTDYFGDANRGDLATIAAIALSYRISADVSVQAMVGFTTGARGEETRVATGLVWAPQPLGTAVPGKNDRDGDGVPDSLDACRNEPEDKDGFQDEDGCPEGDNDKDGIPDDSDKCRDEAEDKDGFEDTDGCPERDNDKDGIVDAIDRCPDLAEDFDNFADDDGCPDEDNDGDGIPDTKDKCPNEPETFNSFEDDDGCPDVRGTSGPEERPDRIDTKGVTITFAGAAISPRSKPLLDQVATIIKTKKLPIRIEVHVPLGTRATAAAAIAAQKQRDKTLSQQRAKSIFDYLVSQGVAARQLQAVGLGSDRPLGAFAPTDAANQRVDFIKAQQRGTP